MIKENMKNNKQEYEKKTQHNEKISISAMLLIKLIIILKVFHHLLELIQAARGAATATIANCEERGKVFYMKKNL